MFLGYFWRFLINFGQFCSLEAIWQLRGLIISPTSLDRDYLLKTKRLITYKQPLVASNGENSIVLGVSMAFMSPF